jgi:hypothetical protein
MASGQTLADTAIKKNLIRKTVIHQSNLLSVGLQVVPKISLDDLDVRFSFPTEMSGNYPVADDAVAPREKITWSSFDLNLRKGQVHYFITDSAQLRSIQGVQNTVNARKSAEALAKQIDGEIISVLLAGASTSNDVTAGSVWTSAAADPEKDIISAYSNLLANSNASMEDLKNLALIVPASTFAQLTKLTLIGNVQQTVKNYLSNAYGIDVLPSRDTTNLSSNALLAIKGDLTAQHGVLSDRAAAAAQVPLVERERVMGSGWDYLITEWFRTTVIEDTAGSSGVTKRIAQISGVTA